jgi:hypothetical protein
MAERRDEDKGAVNDVEDEDFFEMANLFRATTGRPRVI